MAKILRELLQAAEPTFSLSLRQLEMASGQAGRDTKLIAEIAQKMRASTTALGLDPDDTTGPELYAAQMSRIANDNKRVAALIGGSDSDDVRHMAPLMVEAVKNLEISKDCWVLKRSVAKKLLKAMPPKQLMKRLGHRSVDSMLKHENIDEVYTALRFSEGPEWLNKYNDLLKSVTPSDFEPREISFLIMDHDKYLGLAEHFVNKKMHNVVHTKEMGTIGVLPIKQERMKGNVLKTLPQILHYVNEVRLYSAFFKLKQVLPSFGEIVVSTLLSDPSNAAEMAGQYVHWRVIQRYFGRPNTAGEVSHPEVFEPHVQPEDLHWRKAEEMLAQIDPAMKFWLEQDYVGKLYDGKPMTFNLMDLALSYSNSESYETAYSYHFRESLWNEIFTRYMGVKNLREQILGQLDNEMIIPDEIDW